MENWKKALVVGATTASAVMFLKKRTTAGILLAGAGLVALASEYPEAFDEIRRRLPEYAERGTTFLDLVSRAGARLAEAAQSQGSDLWEELSS